MASWLTSPILSQDPKLQSSRQNRCKETIWPGISSGAGHPPLINGRLQLKPNEKTNNVAPTRWSGRFWARSGCTFNQSGKQGNCTTGDCGGLLQCSGIGGGVFTLDSPEDFYDVCLVDGFNMPVPIVPSGGSGNCSAVKCSSNLNLQCLEKSQVRVNDGGETVACKSASLAFDQPQFCCTGAYNNPQVASPVIIQRFSTKRAPTAYSYP